VFGYNALIASLGAPPPAVGRASMLSAAARCAPPRADLTTRTARRARAGRTAHVRAAVGVLEWLEHEGTAGAGGSFLQARKAATEGASPVRLDGAGRSSWTW
jgi:hypothetical protein